jgi:adenosylcobinamide-GDP ribazoletransferase
LKRLVANEVVVFALALQFLTRIPVPVGEAYTPERLAAAPRYFPLIGILVGSLCAAVYTVAQIVFPNTVSILLAIAAGLLLTGAFHEDGLADTSDGITTLDPEKALAVMRDSRIGTYGSLALGMVLALKTVALTGLESELVAMALAVAHGLSRLSAVLVIASSRYLRDHGTGKPTADGIGKEGLATAVLTGLGLLAWVAWSENAAAMLCVLVGLLAGHTAMRALFERRLGGYTGDTLGAVQQTSELGVYLGLLAWQ